MKKHFILIDIKNYEWAKLTHHLQQLSYFEESKIIDYPNFPPLLKSVDDLMRSTETFVGYYKESLVGCISYRINKDELAIMRLIVHPHYFRQGIAKKLLDYVECIDSKVRLVTVSTAQKNFPAVQLYESYGYHLKNIKQLPDGLKLVYFEKKIQSLGSHN